MPPEIMRLELPQPLPSDPAAAFQSSCEPLPAEPPDPGQPPRGAHKPRAGLRGRHGAGHRRQERAPNSRCCPKAALKDREQEPCPRCRERCGSLFGAGSGGAARPAGTSRAAPAPPPAAGRRAGAEGRGAASQQRRGRHRPGGGLPADTAPPDPGAGHGERPGAVQPGGGTGGGEAAQARGRRCGLCCAPAGRAGPGRAVWSPPRPERPRAAPSGPGPSGPAPAAPARIWREPGRPRAWAR